VSDLAALYGDLILDHSRRSRHVGPLAGATHSAEAVNAACGDRIRLAVRLAGGRLEAIAFEGEGCAIARASASLLAERLQGRSISEAAEIAADVSTMLAGGPTAQSLGPLSALVAVNAFPARRACARLAWEALETMHLSETAGGRPRADE
jgi:nitrogen fixation NifU-like protein